MSAVHPIVQEAADLYRDISRTYTELADAIEARDTEKHEALRGKLRILHAMLQNNAARADKLAQRMGMT